MKIKGYAAIGWNEENREEVGRQINTMIKKGWVPHGNLTALPGHKTIWQVFVKHKDPEEEKPKMPHRPMTPEEEEVVRRESK
jgi:hypothetical protein